MPGRRRELGLESTAVSRGCSRSTTKRPLMFIGHARGTFGAEAPDPVNKTRDRVVGVRN